MDAYDIEQKQKEAAATAKELKKQEGETPYYVRDRT